MGISEKDYCSRVCKGKCCKPQIEGKDFTCPNLDAENLCTIYERRFVSGDQFRWGGLVQIGGQNMFISYHCGHIKDILAKGELDPEIVNQCCIAHPELLKENYDQC